ncbi:hypothetical protein CHS0354_005586 [Potamilus streckersoni]|uniref:G domain-containing protein n=1 Tax=Potamilus streckersoni TaxID=2493646 RepID=A0AAE0RNI1_9BIVA|nr:hypothetical protein CHS0354_005586 [Potamilus streckersoni]
MIEYHPNTSHINYFQNRTTLIAKVANFSIPHKVNVPEARILMIGPVGAGKSRFFNTINSIFNDRITNQSNTGSAVSSLTTVTSLWDFQSLKRTYRV